jgi:hypothetical protein
MGYTFNPFTGKLDVIDGGGLVVANANTGITANPNFHYLTDTSGGAFVLTLPSGNVGDVVRVSDAGESWDVENLTVTPAAGEEIDGYGVGASLVCDVVGAWVQFVYNGSRWVVEAPATGSSASIDASAITTGVLPRARLPDGQLPVMIEAPAVKDYYLLMSADAAIEIDSIKVKTISGALVFSLRINSTDITGISTVAAGPVEATFTATGANSLVAGDDLILEVESISSPVDFISNIIFSYT